MPHQCVRCGFLVEDGSDVILKGCPSCTSKLFFFIKQSRLDELKEPSKQLTAADKEQIEKDVMDIVGPEYDNDAPIVLNFENIRISEPGKFEIDIVNLFDNSNPLVYKLEEGKYIIDVATTFEHATRKSTRVKKAKLKK
jgi:predicted  nucleic acid-binding Zn-ribbon protein